jgi:polyphenol oxidase
MLTYPAWSTVPGLHHGFLDGPESESGDWAAIVGGEIVVPRQVHGTRMAAAEPGGERPEADGLVTAPGAPAVGVVTADCMPVLLVDRRRGAAAAVHAGWRGAAAGILEAAVHALGGEAQDLEAVVGPAIGGCCYEVGGEVLGAFRARTGDVTREAWWTAGRRPHLDLRTAARRLLLAAGVGSVSLVGPCTRCDAAYRSYRRDGTGCGRQLSFVGWA